MSYIRITKAFTFEAAHALKDYDGKCANIHGHSYKLEVTVIGKPENDRKSHTVGMVMDFADLKKIIHKEVLSLFDHALLLKEDDERAAHFGSKEKLLPVSYQPTCENILQDVVKRLQPKIKKFARLHSVILHETATSKAGWHATDN